MNIDTIPLLFIVCPLGAGLALLAFHFWKKKRDREMHFYVLRQCIQNSAAVGPIWHEEPEWLYHGPIQVSSTALERALSRVERHLRVCLSTDDLDAIERQVLMALEEVDLYLMRDHWISAEVLAWLGYVKLCQGDPLGAREHWDHAWAISLEWPRRCDNTIIYLERALSQSREFLGF